LAPVERSIGDGGGKREGSQDESLAKTIFRTTFPNGKSELLSFILNFAQKEKCRRVPGNWPPFTWSPVTEDAWKCFRKAFV
jgi:hypothetical protein